MMKNVKIFIRTFFSVLFLLLLFGGLFLYYTISDFEPASKNVKKREHTDRYIFLIQITGEDNTFFFIDINEKENLSEISLLPNCTEITYNQKTQTADYFYNYGGAEYLCDALFGIADIDGYIEFEWENLSDFADEISGFLVDMPFSSDILPSGRQTVTGDDFMKILKYQSTLTEKGKADFKPKLCESVIKGIVSDRYGISCDMLYKSITKYARTDIKSTDFLEAYSLIREMSAEKRISLCSLDGEYRGENEIKFKISQSQQKKLKQSD